MLDEQAARRPLALAVISGEQQLTFAQLAARSRQVAGMLRDLSVRRGDRVGLLINNRPEWLEAAFGAWLLGAVVVPFSTWSTQVELEFLLADSDVRVLVTLQGFAREDFAANLRAIAPDLLEGRVSTALPSLSAMLMIDGAAHGFTDYATARDAAEPLGVLAPGDGAGASDDAMILYTSGSTSKPKAIPLAHYLIVENSFNIGERQGLGPDDRVLLSPPLFWTYGGINAMPATFSHGATLVLQGRFDAGEALDLVERHGCTSIYTLPGMTDDIARHPAFRPERTRTLTKGMTIGSPQDVMKAAEQIGIRNICNVYGASETGGNCCVTQHDWPLERRANCQGLPLPGVRMRIVDPDSHEVLGPDHPGLVEVSGPYVMRGYTGGSAHHNAATYSRDGWFRSGDVGSMTPAGEFVFQGRASEMIKRAGINVSPAEVEDVLMQHPGVAQAGVVGVPSGSGEAIIAFVLPKGDAHLSAEELTAHCRRIASAYKTPDRFEIVTHLPTTVTGKLMRRDLKTAASQLDLRGR
jgi:fatty-acyl-CoA synthase